MKNKKPEAWWSFIIAQRWIKSKDINIMCSVCDATKCVALVKWVEKDQVCCSFELCVPEAHVCDTIRFAKSKLGKKELPNFLAYLNSKYHNSFSSSFFFFSQVKKHIMPNGPEMYAQNWRCVSWIRKKQTKHQTNTSFFSVQKLKGKQEKPFEFHAHHTFILLSFSNLLRKIALIRINEDEARQFWWV